MKINVPEGKTAYDAVIDAILERTNYHLTNYIVKIWTTNLGYANTILTPVLEGAEWKWQFDNDWYEGGEIRLLGFIPLEDVEVPNNVDTFGHWIKLESLSTGGKDLYKCSRCDEIILVPHYYRNDFEYCPYCGKKMEV